MATQLQDLIAHVREVSRDDLTSPVVSDSSIQSYVGFAIDWIANRHPAKKRITATVVDGEITIDDGFTMIIGVYADNISFERTTIERDGPWPGEDLYVVIDDKTIRIGTDSTQVEVYYMSYWAIPVDMTDEISLPHQFNEAILLYAVSRSLSQMAVGTADVSQWNTKADSGNPEHNPLLRVAIHFMAQAEASLTRIIPR